MADEGMLRLTAEAVRDEIENYSQTHPNDFGVADGKSRIPMKKLMKIFEIKKKSSQERQNLFRGLVNEVCELEMMDDIGKVLVLREDIDDNDDDDDDDDTEVEEDYNDMGYGDAAPTIQTAAKVASIVDINKTREERFKPPAPSKSGTSVATADGIGVYEQNEEKGSGEAVRRQGYKRRGSVTRYSIVAQNDVVDEYKKHENIINQFRRDSLKIENSMKNFNLDNDDSNNDGGSSTRDSSRNSKNNSRDNSNGNGGRNSKGRGRKQQDQQIDKDGNAVSRLFRRGRFSLAF
jgi:hypothetical protein